jgi:two-component system response regulator YesN
MRGEIMFSIMIVDDEMSIRENMAKAIPFEESGFTVCATATNGKEALDKMQEIKPDLILLDVCMPILDGLGFLEELRGSRYKETRVIMLSGYSDFEYAKKAMRYGVKAYLTKPIDEEEVFPLLREIQEELMVTKKEKYMGTIREDANLFKKMYNCNLGERLKLKHYIIMHCVVLSMNSTVDEQHPYNVIQQVFSKELEEYEYFLVQSRGSMFTYLLSDKVVSRYRELSLFAKHVLYSLKKSEVECVFLFDSHIFQVHGETFRWDYSNHLYRMLTKVFYGQRGFLLYDFQYEHKSLEKLHIEDQFLDNLKRNLYELNKEIIETEFLELTDEILKHHLGLECLQEINYRIYYLIIDIMASINNLKCEEPILQPPEWRDYPFFISFDKWKQMQLSQIMEAYKFIERSRLMSNMGICSEVVEYVHRNYREQITLKDVADLFYINPVYLGRAFQKATGVSFKQYINELRITEAKRLLSQTDKLIYEIAEQVGYSESKYFIAKFINEVGVSPSNYRRG